MTSDSITSTFDSTSFTSTTPATTLAALTIFSPIV